MSSENTPSNTPGRDAPSERDQWTEAVIRMIELTQSGEIQWRVGRKAAPGRGELTTPPYYADYKNRHYKLEERWIEAPRPTTMEQFLERFSAVAPRRDRHVVNLDLVNVNDLSLYSVPDVSPLWDLLKAVQKQTAADDALRDLLG